MVTLTELHGELEGKRMLKRWLAASALVFALGVLAVSSRAIAQGPPPPPVGYYRPGPWETPPQEFRQDLQRRAYQDGFVGARRDLENRRRPNVLNRDEYRNYRGPAPRLYRAAFQRGYQTFWRHVGARPY